MSSKFVEKLNSVEWLLTDGATGTNLFDMGLMSGDSPELWNEVFLEKAQGLKAGGADLLWLETISAPEEFQAAAETFSYIDLPWVGTMSFDTAGRTMMGTTPTEVVELISSIPNKPVAFGANYGVVPQI